jgi:adenylylsulfate kinase
MTHDNVFWHKQVITREQMEDLTGHSGCVVWLTGLSGSGKSTIANTIRVKLYHRRCMVIVLDGDNMRHGLNCAPAKLETKYGIKFANRFGLAFDEQDREENIRRLGEVARLLCQHGIIVVVAAISPYARDRKRVMERIGKDDFLEVYVHAPVEVCRERDPKGLYERADKGEIPQFTGVSDPYERPKRGVMVDTTQFSIEECADQIIDVLKQAEKI